MERTSKQKFENLVFISKNIMNYMYEPGKPLKFRHISKNLKYGDIVIQILLSGISNTG